jgi:hypothetical protein
MPLRNLTFRSILILLSARVSARTPGRYRELPEFLGRTAGTGNDIRSLLRQLLTCVHVSVLFSVQMHCQVFLPGIPKKRGLSFPDIPEKMPDIDPDDQFVPLVLLFLDLLFDDPKDGGIFLPPGG